MNARRPISILLSAILLACAATAGLAAEKKRVKKKQEYDYENSKYKSYKVLVQEETPTYRFDERGNPIPPPAKKKPVSKKKKKAEPPEETASDGEKPPVCGAGETCQDQESKSSAPEPSGD